jgi:excisionase family DNA binding protein
MTVIPFERPSAEALPPTDEPLTLEEVCRELKIGRTLLYDVLRTGELRSFTIGRKRFVRRSELQRYKLLRERRSTPPGSR